MSVVKSYLGEPNCKWVQSGPNIVSVGEPCMKDVSPRTLMKTTVYMCDAHGNETADD